MKASEALTLTIDSRQTIYDVLIEDIKWRAREGLHYIELEHGIWKEETSPIRDWVISTLESNGYSVSPMPGVLQSFGLEIKENSGFIVSWNETK